jgi:hypothetical protein
MFPDPRSRDRHESPSHPLRKSKAMAVVVYGVNTLNLEPWCLTLTTNRPMNFR